MATKLQDISATNWQLSVRALGEVSQGIDDIRQCIGTILTTTKVSDPIRPEFGSDIWRFMDDPVTTAVADMSAEIIDCLNKWEQRIEIKKLTYDIVGATKIDFNLTAQLVESGEITEILFYIDRQNQIDIPTIGHAFSNGFDLGFY